MGRVITKPIIYGFRLSPLPILHDWIQSLTKVSMNFLKKNLLFYTLFFTAINSSYADEIKPKAEDNSFSFMKLLADNDLHDLKEESWNLYGQTTFISNFHSGFSAAYTNLNGSTNSLNDNAEHGFTATMTFYAGLKLWQGGEIYAVPEIISEKPFSELKGLGGVIQNFELQKNGLAQPTAYKSRLFLTQTFNLGGDKVHLDSSAMQLGKTVDSRRLVIKAGNFSILDFFDKNAFAGDLRRQYMNMAFMKHAAYDFAANARGYTWGGVLEYYHDDWAFRFAHLAVPREPNQLAIDFRIFKYYGDQIEIEHKHTLFGQSGAVRILGYRNRESMARFSDAITVFKNDSSKNATTCSATTFSYGSNNDSAPDLCWVRRPQQKLGIGLNLEQQLASDIGVFFRGMYSDGRTEVYSYTSADRSVSLGALVKGDRWYRENDTVGIAFAESWISKQHATFLDMGGVDGFIGDGKINQKAEKGLNLFYSVNLYRSIWFTGDYQHIINPGFNADRGPVDVYSMKMHLEF